MISLDNILSNTLNSTLSLISMLVLQFYDEVLFFIYNNSLVYFIFRTILVYFLFVIFESRIDLFCLIFIPRFWILDQIDNVEGALGI